MRTIGASDTAMLATREHTLAQCVRIELRDGTVIGITDHDKDLTVDITDISDIPLVFSSSTGVLPSDVTLTLGLDADNFEITGPISDLITRAAVLGKRFTRARVRHFFVDWTKTSPTMIPVMSGKIAESKILGDRFVFEVRSAADNYNQTIGRVLSPYCSADYGDADCGITPLIVFAEITSVTDDFRFVIDQAGIYADNYFNLGQVQFTSGDNAGIDAIEVFDYVGSTSAVTLLVPLASEPEVGDQLTIKRGCSKLMISDDPTLSTCVSNNNGNRFRGFPDVPGSDTYLKTPDPA